VGSLTSHNLISLPPYPVTEIALLSIKNSGRWTNFGKLVILSVVRHCQNASDSMCALAASRSGYLGRHLVGTSPADSHFLSARAFTYIATDAEQMVAASSGEESVHCSKPHWPAHSTELNASASSQHATGRFIIIPFSLEPATCPFHEPDESTLHFLILFL
jgi:hypothetical protein